MILSPAGASPPLNQGPASFPPTLEFAPSGHRVFSYPVPPSVLWLPAPCCLLLADLWPPPPSGSWTHVSNLRAQKEAKSVNGEDTCSARRGTMCHGEQLAEAAAEAVLQKCFPE